MQYLMGFVWVAYIVHALRGAFAEQCLARTLQDLWRRLSSVEQGMRPSEVREILGGPTRINAGSDMTVWQYRIADQFKCVRFSGGRVIHRDSPPAQAAGEL